MGPLNSRADSDPLQTDIQSLIASIRSSKTDVKSRNLALNRLLAIAEAIQYESRITNSFKVKPLFATLPDEDLVTLVSPEKGYSILLTRIATRKYLEEDPEAKKFLLAGRPADAHARDPPDQEPRPGQAAFVA